MQLAAVQGPIARTVADMRLFMMATTAQDSRDIWQVPTLPMDAKFTPPPCKVAVLAESDECPASFLVSDAIRRAAAMPDRAGYKVIDVPVPSIQKVADLWRLIIGNEMRHTLVPLTNELGDDAIRHQLSNLLDGQPDLDRAEFLKVYATRGNLLREWQVFFAETPLLLMANTWSPPMPLNPDQRPELDIDRVHADVAPNIAQLILGLPALAAPMGLHKGISTGVPLVGTRFSENLLLAAGEVFERAQPRIEPTDPGW